MHPNLAYSLEQAAALTQLDPHEICWAVEQFGRCDTQAYTVLPCNDSDRYVVVPRQR